MFLFSSCGFAILNQFHLLMITNLEKHESGLFTYGKESHQVPQRWSFSLPIIQSLSLKNLWYVFFNP
jgi:hypothetical protein